MLFIRFWFRFVVNIDECEKCSVSFGHLLELCREVYRDQNKRRANTRKDKEKC